MNTILSFMDKLYSDSKTLSIIYVVGAVLLFVFIILLMVSLRKPDKKETQKIIEEPKIDEEPKTKEEEVKPVENANVVEVKQEEKPIEQSIFEKTTIIPLSELDKSETLSREENIEKALDNVEKAQETKIEEKEEPTNEVENKNISNEIPSVDEFVDNVVKKTYEKNEQFSSVYVGNNTSTIKLDKVMEDLNVDENVKESIVPEEEKTVKLEVKEDVESVLDEPVSEVTECKNPEPNLDEVSKEPEKQVEEENKQTTSLDDLKKALDEKQKEVSVKQDDLKAKLDSLKKDNTKSSDAMNAEDLLNKLNSLKEK